MIISDSGKLRQVSLPAGQVTTLSTSNIPASTSGFGNITITPNNQIEMLTSTPDAQNSSQSYISLFSGPESGIYSALASNFEITTNTSMFPVIDSNGNLFVSDPANNRILEFPIANPASHTVFAGNGTAGNQDGLLPSTTTLNEPGNLAIDSSDNIYLLDTQNNLIRKLTPTGTLTTIAKLPSSLSLHATPGGIKGFLAVNSAGTHIYFTGLDTTLLAQYNAVYKYDVTTQTLYQYDESIGTSYLGAMALDKSENLYSITYGSVNQLIKVSF